MLTILVREIIRGRDSALSVRPVKKLSGERGFSLIELMAVTAVIAIISGVVFTSNSRFGGQVLLDNLAYDIALSIRQTQVYGISVQRFGTDTFYAGYGVHMDTSNPSTYATFADVGTADGLYDQQNTNELLQTTNLERGFRIIALCAPAGANIATCRAGTGGIAKSSIDVLFKRPEPDAWISAAGGSCTLGSGTCYESLRIVVMSPRGDLSSVIVENNGSISVQKQ